MKNIEEQIKDVEKQVNRVIVWNKFKCGRGFDYEISEILLLKAEEKLNTAKNTLNTLDAVGEITFVAIGTLWKLGASLEQIVAIFESCIIAKTVNDINTRINSFVKYASYELYLNTPKTEILKNALNLVFITGMTSIGKMNLQHKLIEILANVCDNKEDTPLSFDMQKPVIMKNNIEEQVNRAIHWNRERYIQSFDFGVSQVLLLEKQEELYTAITKLDVLNTVGNITFMTIGMLWKLEFSPKLIVSIFERWETITTVSMADLVVNAWIDHLTDERQLNMPNTLLLKQALNLVFVTSRIFLDQIEMRPNLIGILAIICDSNDTKSLPATIQKQDAKDNINKDPQFIPPTEALRELLINRKEK